MYIFSIDIPEYSFYLQVKKPKVIPLLSQLHFIPTISITQKAHKAIKTKKVLVLYKKGYADEWLSPCFHLPLLSLKSLYLKYRSPYSCLHSLLTQENHLAGNCSQLPTPNQFTFLRRAVLIPLELLFSSCFLRAYCIHCQNIFPEIFVFILLRTLNLDIIPVWHNVLNNKQFKFEGMALVKKWRVDFSTWVVSTPWGVTMPHYWILCLDAIQAFSV